MSICKNEEFSVIAIKLKKRYTCWNFISLVYFFSPSLRYCPWVPKAPWIYFWLAFKHPSYRVLFKSIFLCKSILEILSLCFLTIFIPRNSNSTNYTCFVSRLDYTLPEGRSCGLTNHLCRRITPVRLSMSSLDIVGLNWLQSGSHKRVITNQYYQAIIFRFSDLEFTSLPLNLPCSVFR
jgi:hypothetical protein